MSVSDNKISAVYGAGRDMLRTKAHLAAWIEARRRGISVEDCDAIADAAMDAVIETLEKWEASRDDSA